MLRWIQCYLKCQTLEPWYTIYISKKGGSSLCPVAHISILCEKILFENRGGFFAKKERNN